MNSPITTIVSTVMIAGIIVWIVSYILILRVRHKHNAIRAKGMKRYRIMLPKKDSDSDTQRSIEKDFKEKIALMEQLYSALHGIYNSGIKAWITGQEYIGFELVGSDLEGEQAGTEIGFYIIMGDQHEDLLRKQVSAYYDDANIVEDERDITVGAIIKKGASFSLRKPYYYPIKTYQKLGMDPLNGLTSVLSNLSPDSHMSIQIMLRPLGNSWMSDARHISSLIMQNKAPMFRNKLLNFVAETLASAKKSDQAPPPITEVQQQQSKAIAEKASKLGYDVVVRVVAIGATEQSVDVELENAMTTFSQFDDPIINGLAVSRKGLSVVEQYQKRSIEGTKPIILNTEELASIYHLPDAHYNTNPQIKWQSTRMVPAPQGLADSGIRLGWNIYRGEKKTIYLSDKDRFRHLYVIGQTGMGKSQLLKTMAKQDIAAGRGFCALDPHGELADDLLPWIPKERMDDLILIDPADTSRPFGLNLFEAETPEDREFVANDALKIMIGLFGEEIFSPRLQDYFRNAALTLMEDMDEPGAITDLVRIFTDEDWQQAKVKKVTNPVVREWWEHTYAAMGDREKQEMIPFWASKFGQFITNSLIRNIIGQSKSAINFAEAMDNNKIILVKLSKGLVGDLNTQLLGMIVVNKIQVAAMQRAKQPKDQRVPFYLYVDEFQNFVTDAFESILSEARKYKLGLIVAHQYISQLSKGQDDKVKNAVFGNVGSMVSFKVGAPDAEALVKEFSPSFSEQDLTKLEGFNIACKVSNNNVISSPFSVMTEKDFDDGDGVRAQALAQYSKLRFGRDKADVESSILGQIGKKTLNIVKNETAK